MTEAPRHVAVGRAPVLTPTSQIPECSPEMPVPTYSTKTSSTSSVWGREQEGDEVSPRAAGGHPDPLSGLGRGQR